MLANMSVLLVYECDVWLSTYSRTLVAICENNDKLSEFLRGFQRCSYDQMCQIEDIGQSQCGNKFYRNNFIVEEVEMNKCLD